jgi:hypothetical protein
LLCCSEISHLLNHQPWFHCPLVLQDCLVESDRNWKACQARKQLLQNFTSFFFTVDAKSVAVCLTGNPPTLLSCCCWS